MASNNNSGNGASGGAGIAGVLGVAFVVLKLLHKISWPWVWVTAPFWGGAAIALVILLVIALFIGGTAAALGMKSRRR